MATVMGSNTMPSAEMPPRERIQKFESMVYELQLANETLRRELDLEVQMSALLQEELAPLAKIKKELGYSSSIDGELHMRQEEGNDLRRQIAMLQEENASLSSRLQQRRGQQGPDGNVEAQERNAGLRVQLLNRQQAVVGLRRELDYQQSLPTASEADRQQGSPAGDSERMDALWAQIKARQDENLQLRRGLALGAARPPHVEVVFEDRTVDKPRVEVKLTEVPNQSRVNLMIREKKELEDELQRREAEWRAKYEWLEQQPPKVDVRYMETVSSRRVEQLIDDLNAREMELVRLRKLMVEHQSVQARQIVYVDRDHFLEVPHVDVQRVEYENTALLLQLQKALETKDQELAHVREMQRRVEAQLRNIELGAALPGFAPVADSRPPPSIRTPPATTAPMTVPAPLGGCTPDGGNFVAYVFGVPGQ
eukprot:NODE_6332_length_1681_cov_10.889961.p1 GENE.NODE_6332_length_1681_cov_10.889961~~NODE_6332_length_1681_cov_10.889961.p1  ORF type:complete len:472 (+),score=146.59 NODE_6332_length_1681_cov_10.889961:147-1418(+)